MLPSYPEKGKNANPVGAIAGASGAGLKNGPAVSHRVLPPVGFQVPRLVCRAVSNLPWCSEPRVQLPRPRDPRIAACLLCSALATSTLASR